MKGLTMRHERHERRPPKLAGGGRREAAVVLSPLSRLARCTRPTGASHEAAGQALRVVLGQQPEAGAERARIQVPKSQACA